MKNSHDPVDSVFEILRSDPGSPETFNRELETRLMDQHGKTEANHRFFATRTLAVALALLAVGGVTFATTGGVEKLRQWLFTVEVGGEVTEVSLGPDGEQTLTFDIEDGGTATVSVKKSSTDEGDMTRVQVTQSNEETGQETDVVQKRIIRRGEPQDMPKLTLKDLGDAQPVASWEDDDERLNELYLLPAIKGKGTRVIHVLGARQEEPEVRQIGKSPRTMPIGEIEPEVSFDEEGAVVLKFDDGFGRVEAYKFLIRRQAGDAEVRRPMKFETPGGIKVEIEEVGEDE